MSAFRMNVDPGKRAKEPSSIAHHGTVAISTSSENGLKEGVAGYLKKLLEAMGKCSIMKSRTP